MSDWKRIDITKHPFYDSEEAKAYLDDLANRKQPIRFFIRDDALWPLLSVSVEHFSPNVKGNFGNIMIQVNLKFDVSEYWNSDRLPTELIGDLIELLEQVELDSLF